MRRKVLQVLGVGVLVTLLSGCRVFIFPSSSQDKMITSDIVTISNPTDDSFYVRIDIDCSGAEGQPIYVVGNGTGARAALCIDGTEPSPVNGTLQTSPGNFFVLEAGASVDLTAMVNMTQRDFLGRAVAFDAYGEWCYLACYDIVKFT